LQASPHPRLRWIVPMLVLTGARKSEVLNARWEDFDLGLRQWRIELNKSGSTRYVPMSEAVVELLESVPRLPGVPHVFANPLTGRPYINIYHAWNAVR